METDENITYQNFWDTAKSGIKREVCSNTALLRKQKKNHNLILHLKKLEKEVKSKVMENQNRPITVRKLK